MRNKAKRKTDAKVPATNPPKGETPEVEKVEATSRISAPMNFLLAALACSATGQKTPKGQEPKDHLKGVRLHAAGKVIRVVGTDGHRVFVGSFPWLGEMPGWLTKGVTIPGELLKDRLALIAKGSGSDAVSIAFSTNAARIELADALGSAVFRVGPVYGGYPEIDRVIAATGDRPDDATVDFKPIGFNSAYLKHVGDVAKILRPEAAVDPATGKVKSVAADFVSMYAQSETRASAFTFAGVPGAVLYIMTATTQQLLPETAAIMAPAVKSTLAALRAHQTRNEVAAKEEKDAAQRAIFLDKAASFQARIAAITKSLPKPALPAPAKPDATPAETATAAEPAKGAAKAPAAPPATGKAPEPAPVKKPGKVVKPKLPKKAAKAPTKPGPQLVKKAAINGAPKHH